jgi:hypothetical protein
MKRELTQVVVILFLLFSANIACSPEHKVRTYIPNQDFKDYWYQGKAELNRYELEQARYGEIHKGYAVLVFVKEDFLRHKQVKSEHGPSDDALPVLKVNAIRKFETGIYAYSILTSVFTPFDLKNVPILKISNSNQDWCGHTYAQINLRGEKYEGLAHSYFEDEADHTFKIKKVLLEDEIWARIRLNPQSLPTGELEIFPGLHFIRLRHKKFESQRAKAQLSTIVDTLLSEEPINVYTVDYQSIDRKLKIMFEPDFPYSILGWEETYRSGWGAKTRELTTRATRTNVLVTDYWTKNSVADSTYRKMLGL